MSRYTIVATTKQGLTFEAIVLKMSCRLAESGLEKLAMAVST